MERVPDIVVSFELNKIKDNGESMKPILPPYLMANLIYDDQYYSVRIIVEGEPILPGMTRKVGIQFLDPSIIVPKLSEGARVTLWGVTTLGLGTILKINWAITK